MSEVFDINIEAELEKIEKEAEKEIESALKEIEKSIRNFIHDTNPLIVAARSFKALATAASRLRPPMPDELAKEFVEKAVPTPDEVAKLLPEILPNPKEAAEAMVKYVDPLERATKLATIATPIAILGAGIAIAIAIALGGR